ncbi:rhomboid family intramembrane serine protease [candidate division KSB1 bacterium]|nr:rhomboid family intramembrane serine protease [candidate division KSB1 bacterium]
MANRNIKAIVCPNCGKLINGDAESCMHCGMKNPGGRRWESPFRQLFKGKLDVIQKITYLCIGLYVIALLLDPSYMFKSSGFFGLLAPSPMVLYRLGAAGTYAMAAGKWWSLVTAIYLHGGLLHILFNLLWIRQIGPVVEELYGSSRFMLIFTYSGVLGFIASNLFHVPLTIGASGSIFGLLGALVFYGRHRGGVFGEAIFRQVMTWAVMLFIFGFLFPGINNYAHGGGFIGGYLAAQLLGYNERKHETQAHRTASTVTVIGTVVCFVLAFVVG